MPLPDRVPPIVAFTGTMTDAPGRANLRFPDEPALVEQVRAAIAAKLTELGSREGVSSAARGSDLLFLEEVLARGGRATVLLPFPRDEFKRASVGNGWNERFDALVANANVEVRVLTPAAPPEEDLPAAFAACNDAIGQQAAELGARFGAQVRLLAVWDGRPGDGRGGTADFVEAWERSTGSHADVIRLPRPG